MSNKEQVIEQLMRDYNLTREQAMEVYALRDYGDGDVVEIPSTRNIDSTSSKSLINPENY